MSTAVKQVKVSEGPRFRERRSLNKEELSRMSGKLRARFSKQQVRGFVISPNSNGAVICMIPGNRFLEQYVPHDATSREGIAEMIARAITPRMWELDHHAWLDESVRQPLFGEMEKHGLVNHKGIDFSNAWFLRLYLIPKRSRFVFDPRLDPDAQKSVSLNYDAWYIPVRQADLDNDGKLIPGKGREILRRHTLSDLAPLFTSRPLIHRELERKIRKGDIREAVADPGVFQIIGEQRLLGTRHETRPSVSLKAILDDAGVKPRTSIDFNRFVEVLIGLDPEALRSFYDIWVSSSSTSKTHMLQYARKNDIYRATRGRIYSLRPMQVLALMMNDLSQVRRVVADWRATGITTVGPIIFGKGGTGIRSQWQSAISGKGPGGVRRFFDSLSLIDQLLTACWLRETNEEFYKRRVFQDLTGRKKLSLA